MILFLAMDHIEIDFCVIDNKAALVQLKARCIEGNKPLPATMFIKIYDAIWPW